MKKLLTKVTTSFSLKLLIFIGILLYSNSINSQIIEKIKYTADSMMLTMLGTEYFSKTKLTCLKVAKDDNFSFCDSNSIISIKLRNSLINKYHLPTDKKYFLIYDFELEDKYSYPIVLAFDSLGKCNKTIWDIPDCRDSLNCHIEIDSIAAKKIAEVNDFPKGISKWETTLKHDRRSGYLYWEIKNVTEVIDSENHRKISGISCRVRAFDGKYTNNGDYWSSYQLKKSFIKKK